MANELFWIADIGGTKILLMLIDSDKSVIFRKKISTPFHPEPQSLVDVLKKEILLVEKEIISPAGGRADKLGISMAGFVDHGNGLVHQSPNLEWHLPVTLAKMVGETTGLKVTIENDANAAVVGEAYYGAARGFKDAVYVTVSTGIGGGLFLDGKLYRGSNGFAGEIGHIKPFGKNRSCKCGGENCLEAWASGNAIACHGADLLGTGISGNKIKTAEDVFTLADSGNTVARSIIHFAADNVGIGLSNLVNIINPACLILGGGIAFNREDFLERISKKIFENAIRPAVNITPLKIIRAELEPEAGIWGMYALLSGQAE
ncbi:MAG: ROK family protein [Bacillota bacterium]|nr:ROK family protein [Bacillota bacterium]